MHSKLKFQHQVHQYNYKIQETYYIILILNFNSSPELNGRKVQIFQKALKINFALQIKFHNPQNYHALSISEDRITKVPTSERSRIHFVLFIPHTRPVWKPFSFPTLAGVQKTKTTFRSCKILAYSRRAWPEYDEESNYSHIRRNTRTATVAFANSQKESMDVGEYRVNIARFEELMGSSDFVMNSWWLGVFCVCGLEWFEWWVGIFCFKVGFVDWGE